MLTFNTIKLSSSPIHNMQYACTASAASAASGCVKVIQAPVAAEALKTADGFSPKKRKKTQRADEVRIEQRDAIKWAGDGLLSIVDKLGDAVRKLEVSCPM